MKTSGTTNKAIKSTISPAIPYQRPSKKEVNKEDLITFKIKANPDEDSSPQHSITIEPFSSGTPEEFLIFGSKVEKINKGLALAKGANQYALMRQLLQGDTLGAFNTFAEAAGDENEANYASTINALTKYIFPHRALAIQKKYMRRHMRKPFGVSIRQYKARLEEMRLYLKEFPDYTEAQAMDDDDLKEILEHAIPASWQKEMTRQGFEPINNTLNEFVEFCERMEVTESLSTSTGVKPNTNQNGGKYKAAKWQAKSSARGNNTDKSKYCVYHKTYGHDTGECKVILAQAKRMRGQWEASGIGHSNKKPYKPYKPYNKTYKPYDKNNGNNSSFNKESLNNMICQAVNTALKQANQANYSIEEFEQLNMSDNSDNEE